MMMDDGLLLISASRGGSMSISEYVSYYMCPGDVKKAWLLGDEVAQKASPSRCCEGWH